jgi:hypothetical protein
MLFVQYRGAKDDDADREKIDREPHLLVIFYPLPGLLHFTTPIDIVEYDNGVLIRFFKYLREVADRWFVAVIAVDECEINSRQFI